ncbi:hypothetical protein GALMADRAFT_144678 [Galerina marginata CBS 339.88]|uniref:Uncharacterized protein n=1 Tax=Galerina marginata (strain CBS 339.88) TaxID=685588 RepID=A0A067SRP8_GALM3|nr:hypothetical protein GALMADRAFT_144678 [Galerina marginata CBS 339.88]
MIFLRLSAKFAEKIERSALIFALSVNLLRQDITHWNPRSTSYSRFLRLEKAQYPHRRAETLKTLRVGSFVADPLGPAIAPNSMSIVSSFLAVLRGFGSGYLMSANLTPCPVAHALPTESLAIAAIVQSDLLSDSIDLVLDAPMR